MAQWLSPLIGLASKGKKSMPLTFKILYVDAFMYLTAQRCLYRETHNNYNTIRVLIAIFPEGTFSFLSNTGRVS